MATPLDELEKVAKLLALEKKEDYERFRKMMKSLPMEERIVKGYCWYPIKILRTGYTIGDRAYLIIKREKNTNLPHHFRSGQPINFFTKASRIHHPERSGTVDYVHRNKMRIILNTTDIPNWIKFDPFGVEVMFDARSYDEMEKAMKRVMQPKRHRFAELRDVLLGHRLPESNLLPSTLSFSFLNDAQQKAVQNIVAAKDVAIVHGPPGTGKTTTLIHAIKEMCKTERTILVTAPSNTAVDLLTERLAQLEINVIRIGNIARVEESVLEHTLEVQLSKHPESKNIKKIRLQAVELRRKAWRIRRKYSRKERSERDQYKKDATELSAWARQLEDHLMFQLIASAQVITCTLVGSAHRFLEGHKFGTIVIDEAAQALEPATWIPISRANKVVLAGDPFQLPPTVKSLEAKKGNLGITLIEKSIQRLTEVNFLNVQYRMNERIMCFSNEQFYGGALVAADSVKNHLLYEDDERPVEFIDTAGCGFDEKLKEESLSRYNPDEFQILCEHLYQLAKHFSKNEPPSIAIISPYREQVIYMSEIVEEDEILKSLPISINTIDGFQGQESDVVYISLVRSNSKAEIGFLNDYRRMNVAMTRAKKKLIVVGDSATIGGDKFYDAFLSYCDKIGAYRTAWEFMI